MLCNIVNQTFVYLMPICSHFLFMIPTRVSKSGAVISAGSPLSKRERILSSSVLISLIGRSRVTTICLLFWKMVLKVLKNSSCVCSFPADENEYRRSAVHPHCGICCGNRQSCRVQLSLLQSLYKLIGKILSPYVFDFFIGKVFLYFVLYGKHKMGLSDS